jgi:hypothetical protein
MEQEKRFEVDMALGPWRPGRCTYFPVHIKIVKHTQLVQIQAMPHITTKSYRKKNAGQIQSMT